MPEQVLTCCILSRGLSWLVAELLSSTTMTTVLLMTTVLMMMGMMMMLPLSILRGLVTFRPSQQRNTTITMAEQRPQPKHSLVDGVVPSFVRSALLGCAGISVSTRLLLDACRNFLVLSRFLPVSLSLSLSLSLSVSLCLSLSLSYTHTHTGTRSHSLDRCVHTNF